MALPPVSFFQFDPTINYGSAGFDVETFSPTPIENGAWNYTRDPRAELLCFAPSIDGHCLDLWTPGQPVNQDWLAAVYGAGHLATAFNWFFEFCVFNNIMVRQLDLPHFLPVEKFDCVAARSRTYGLPQKLEGVTKHLGIEMGKITNYLQVTKPRKPSAKNPDDRWYLHTAPDKFERLYQQCVLDEWGEVTVDYTIPAWCPHEREVFKMDQQINARGVPIDLEFCNSAVRLIGELEAKYWTRLRSITGNQVQTHSETANIRDFINASGYNCTSIAKDHVDTMLADPQLPAVCREVLEIRQTMGLESIKKFYKFINMTDPTTGKLYDQFMFYGAQATGRWAARGCQLHNLARGNLKVPKGVDYDDYIDGIMGDFKTCNLEQLEAKYGASVVSLMSSMIRPTITAPPGKELCVSDFSNIEGRVIFWLADVIAGLHTFRTGRDLYIDVAADIYGTPYDELYAAYKSGDSAAGVKRQMGKQAALGLNYQMGDKTFLATVNGYNIVWCAETQDWTTVEPGMVKQWRDRQATLYTAGHDADGRYWGQVDLRDHYEIQAADKVVQAYRAKFPELKVFWKALEKAAIAAVNTGQPQRVGGQLVFELFHHNGFQWLRCRFPSGQYLYWFSPRVEMRRASWCDNDEDPDYRPQLTFLKWVKGRFVRESTYGGDLAESVTQKIARDFLCHGIKHAVAGGYPVILHVHDEAGALMDKGKSDIEEFNRLLCTPTTWGADCPIAAEGWVGKHYRKD